MPHFQRKEGGCDTTCIRIWGTNRIITVNLIIVHSSKKNLLMIILRTVLFPVTAIVGCNLSEVEEGTPRTSILRLPGSILVVPQATLGGRLKGKCMQYHNNVEKAAGLELYTEFVQTIKLVADTNEAWKEKGCVVVSGTYGNRQVLRTDTNGPYTHLIEF